MSLDAVAAGLPPLLVWGIFSRLLGVMFLVSFLSIAGQIIPLAGKQGFAPVGFVLDHVRKCFSPLKRIAFFPTLLWLNSSDRVLRVLPFLGAVAAASVVVGGEHSPWALFACYLVYHTLDRAVGLVFPWDCVLFEAGFFGMFLPATHLLPDFTAVSAPAPAIALFYRLLPLRVLLGFGKFKFIGATKHDNGYLTGFLINQPMVSPIGYYLHKAPLPLLKLAMVGMFIVEVPAPLFLVWPGWPGIVAAVGIAGLMLGIWACGNFGYFNMVVSIVLVPCLDTTTVKGLDLSAFDHLGTAIPTAVVLAHCLGVLVVFPFNSLMQQCWFYYPLWLRIRPKLLSFPIAAVRVLHPLRWLHPYGVFPPKTMVGVKCVVLFEVTWDGKTWVECRHRFSPSHEGSTPKFVAPYHPRCDQAIVYETFGLNDPSLMRTFLGTGIPIGFAKHSGVRALSQRILDGNTKNYGSVFFEAGTFDGHEGPPIAVRSTTVMLEPLPLEERKNGKWWRRRYVGPHMPETTYDPNFYDRLLPVPELWHPEDVIWKRRSVLTETTRRHRAGEDPHTAVLAGSDLTKADLERFWNEFVPLFSDVDRSTFDSAPDFVEKVRATFDADTLYRFERIFGRYSFLMSDRVDPLFFDAGLRPIIGTAPDPLGAKSYFHLTLFNHLAILDGKAAVESVLRDPATLARYAEGFTLERGLFALCVFRFEPFIFEAQKIRLLMSIMEPKRPLEAPPPPDKKAKFEAIAIRCIGVLEFMPFIIEKFKGPRFANGQPERYPEFHVDARGVAVEVKRPDTADAAPDAA